MFKNMKVLTKMVLVTVIAVVLFALLLSYSTNQTVEKQLTARIHDDLQISLDNIYTTIEVLREHVLSQVNASMQLTHNLFYQNHQLDISDETVSIQAVHQITKKSQQIDLPLWKLDDQPLHQDHRFVDQILATAEVTCTVFQRFHGGFLRISTNVKKMDGQRATGTYIPLDSPVSQAILDKKTFTGRAFVVNDWYLTVYEPIIDNNQVVGILYVGVPEKILIDPLQKVINQTHIGENGYVYLLDPQGTTILHPTLDHEDLSQNQETQTILASEAGQFRYMNQQKEKKMTVFRFLPDFNAYVVADAFEADYLAAPLRAIRFNSLLISCIAVLILIVSIGLLTKKIITQPLNEFVHRFQQGADGDLTIRMRLINKDEIGTVSQAFNRFAKNLQKTFLFVHRDTFKLAENTSEMLSSSEAISRIIENQSASMQQISATITEISASTDEVASSSEQVSASVTQISSTMKNLQGAIHLLGEHIQDLNQQSMEVKHSTEKGLQSIHMNNKTMQKITESSTIINDRMEAVVDIAEQIKLLALNAAIVAAQAGEHGRGFSVVADAINNLAQQAGKTAAEITNIAQDNVQAAEKGLNISQETLEMIEYINKKVDLSAQISEKVRTEVKHQIASVQEIALATDEIALSTENVSQAMQQQASGVNQISQAIDNIAQQATDTSINVNEITQANEELMKIAQNLRDFMQQFKLGANLQNMGLAVKK